MKLNQIVLQESQVEITREHVDAWTSAIIDECEPFLNEGGSQITLYRGDDESQPFMAKRTPSNRKPKDIPPQLHRALDNWFENQFGIPYRSQSVFATGNRRQALEYGDVFLFYPIGQYSYLWGERPHGWDLFQTFKSTRFLEYIDTYHDQYGIDEDGLENSEIGGSINLDVLLQHYPNEISNAAMDFFKQNVTWNHNNDLDDAITDGGEIMFHCEEYFIVNANALSQHNLYGTFFDMLDYKFNK